jgi:hypothetical protein
MARPNAKDPLMPFPVRLPASLVSRLSAEATERGVTNSDVFRSYISLADAKPLGQPRRVRQQKYEGKINAADPALMRALAGIGNNLNQLAYGVNASNLSAEPLSKVQILTLLRSIEEKLDAIGAANAR